VPADAQWQEAYDPASLQEVFLDKLGDELFHRGLKSMYMEPPGRKANLWVWNPDAPGLEETIFVSLGKDGLWWFWWSWAERIAVADDVDQAASTIVRVLASLLPRDLTDHVSPFCTMPASGCDAPEETRGGQPFQIYWNGMCPFRSARSGLFNLAGLFGFVGWRTIVPSERAKT